MDWVARKILSQVVTWDQKDKKEPMTQQFGGRGWKPLWAEKMGNTKFLCKLVFGKIPVFE